MRFKIELTGTLYNIFFGYISTQVISSDVDWRSPFAVGWFRPNQLLQHHDNFAKYGHTKNIKPNDIVDLTFNRQKATN